MLKRCIVCLVLFCVTNLLCILPVEAWHTKQHPRLRFRYARAGSPLKLRAVTDSSTVLTAGTPMAKSVTTNRKTSLPLLPSRGICAHRGESVVYPENTVPAFLEAARLGAHQIEFDVCLTKDGKLVVLHDVTVDRTTNGTGKISELTFDEVRRLDAGIKKGEQFKGTKIPTFDEAIDCMPDNIWINIHLKKDVSGAEVAKTVRQKNRLHQAFLACSLEQAAQARAVCPEVLVCNMSRQPAGEYVDKTIANSFAFIQILKNKYSADEIAKLRQSGVRINCFGIYVTDPDSLLKKMLDDGIDFPLVDSLDHMLRLAEEYGIPRWQPLWNTPVQP